MSEIDPSIWVLFSKQLDSERFSVRFPSDPVCARTEHADLTYIAEKEGERFELVIQKKGGQRLLSEAFFCEDVIETERYIYTFRSSSDPEKHALFYTSFSPA